MNANDNPKRDLLDDPIRNAPIVTGPRRANHPAAHWQIIATSIAVFAILAIVFFGLNSQRDESKPGGEQSAVTEITPSAPQGGGNVAAPQANQPQGNQQQAAPPNQQQAPQPQQNAQQPQQAAPAQNPGQSKARSTTGQAPANGGDNQNESSRRAQ